MLVNKTLLDGVLKITPLTIHADKRGTYTELYNEALYKQLGVNFVQDDVSCSRRNVIRGFHGDFKTWKLISCVYGVIQFKVVNNLKNHPQYGMVYKEILSHLHPCQILIPPGFGNAHGVLTDFAVFHYKQSTYYDRESQFTLPWNAYGAWVIKEPILSERDEDAAR